MPSKTSSDKKNGKHSGQKESDNKRSLTVRLNLSMGQQIYLTSLIKAYTSIAKKLHEEARAKFMELTTNGEIKNIKELKDVKKKFNSWFNEYFKTQRKWITDSLGSNISDQLFQFLMAQYKNFFANYENFFEHKVDGRPSFPSLPELFQIRDRGVEVDFDKKILIIKLKGKQLRLKFQSDRILYHGDPGAVTIKKIDGKFYAYIPFDFNPKFYEGKKGAIDIGLSNFFAAVTEDGDVILVKAKQYTYIYNMYKQRIKELDRMIGNIRKHTLKMYVTPPKSFRYHPLLGFTNNREVSKILISLYTSRYDEKRGKKKKLTREDMTNIVKKIRKVNYRLRIRRLNFMKVDGHIKLFPKKSRFMNDVYKDLPILHKLEYERRKLFEKRDRTLTHIRRTAINALLRILKERGVTRIAVGYPRYINRNRNELTVNLFQYRKTINDLKIIGERYGIKVEELEEYGTSIRCSICGEEHKNGRIERGLYRCEKTGKTINADVNGALNIFYNAFSTMPKQLKKIETIKLTSSPALKGESFRLLNYRKL
jgi:transposase